MLNIADSVMVNRPSDSICPRRILNGPSIARINAAVLFVLARCSHSSSMPPFPNPKCPLMTLPLKSIQSYEGEVRRLILIAAGAPGFESVRALVDNNGDC